MSEHKLHLYTGTGKGKTTAAMGLALRALGHGWRVLAAQFMKDGTSGELAALASLPGAMVDPGRPLHGFIFQMTPDELTQARREQAELTHALAQIVLTEKPAMVLLDELAVALDTGLVTEEDARTLLSACLSVAETVVTGRNAPSWLHDMSDYVSDIRAEKHPYDTEHLNAREGIEW